MLDGEGQAGTTKRCLVIVECEQRHVVRLDEVVDSRRGTYQVVHLHHGDVAIEPTVTHPDDASSVCFVVEDVNVALYPLLWSEPRFDDQQAVRCDVTSHGGDGTIEIL